MSDFLRSHIQDFGFKHSEISRRASSLNQATTYRVVEGETQNPSLNSITGIIEAISLTDADAGVLYRKMGVNNARPRLLLHPSADVDFVTLKREVKDYLDSGKIRKASQSVMLMFDLAEDDDQLCTTYELAGIVYMGLGRWEEAQVNFEAADAHLVCDLDCEDVPQDLIDRKHTLMTNIGSLMVKRGNHSWAVLFVKSILAHSRTSFLNQGWAHLVYGEAMLKIENIVEAQTHFESAFNIFQTENDQANADTREEIQSQGNIRWAKIHLYKSQGLLGDESALRSLKKCEQDWMFSDPEASTMAGLFYAEQMKTKRRESVLRDLYKRARSQNVGEITQRIAAMLSICLVIGLAYNNDPRSKFVELETVSIDRKGPKLARGNTGK